MKVLLLAQEALFSSDFHGGADVEQQLICFQEPKGDKSHLSQ
jgi:hypothetical protein